MLVPQVSTELMMITYAVATKRDRRGVINTMLQEHSMFDFEDIYAATQRLYALADALRGSDALDPWIIPPAPGEIYSDLSPAMWQAVATARLEASDDPGAEGAYMLARFKAEDLRRSIRLA